MTDIIPKFINTSDLYGQYFINEIVDRIKHNKNCMIAIRGQTGEGKSLSALTLGKVITYELNRQLGLENEFNIDNIFFDMDLLLRKINEFAHDYKRKIRHLGYIYVIDDAGFSLNNQKWQDKYVQAFGMLSQGYRYLQTISIFTVPYIDWIENRSRSLLHYLLSHNNAQGNFKIYRYRESERMDKRYKEFPIYENKQLEEIQFDMPDEDFITEYENKKAEFMSNYLENALQIAIDSKKPKGNKFICSLCGTEYYKDVNKSHCPKCNKLNYKADLQTQE